MRKTAIFAALLLLAGCDIAGWRNQAAAPATCFSLLLGNTLPPHAPLMVNGCTGETWLLVRNAESNKPEDGYTYRWYKLDKIDAWPPTLVDK